MTADGPTVEGSGGTKRQAGAEEPRADSSPKYARLGEAHVEPSAAAAATSGRGAAFESGAKASGEASSTPAAAAEAAATEHGAEKEEDAAGSSGSSSTSSRNVVDRPTSPLVARMGEEGDDAGAGASAGQVGEEGVGALAAEAEAAADSEDELEEPSTPSQQAQPQQQPQQQQQRGAASNGVDHWIMMQRLRGTDPSVLAHSLLQQMGLALAAPLHAMTQEALWALLRRLLTRQDEALAPRRKLPHVNRLDDVVSLIRRSRRVMVLTGAGISVACGIPDFRSENGIYARLGEYGLPDPQCMFDIDFFRCGFSEG